MFICVIIILMHLTKYYSRFWIWPVASLGTILPSLFIGVIQAEHFGYDLISLTKALYLVTVSSALMILIDKYHVKADDLLSIISISAYTYICFLIIPIWLGIGLNTYGDGSYAEGSSGFFTAGIDAGVTLGLSLFAIGYL